MQPIEIIVIVSSFLFVVSVVIISIINRKKGKTGCHYNCDQCRNNKCAKHVTLKK